MTATKSMATAVLPALVVALATLADPAEAKKHEGNKGVTLCVS
jgi:hypothetical protein